MDKNEKGDLPNKGEEFLQIFKKGAEFTQEVIQENERLRYRIVELEQQVKGTRPSSSAPMGPAELEQLRREVEALRKEKEDIMMRYREVEQENKDFANRYVEIEEENNNLANLYISSYQLHSTLDFREVLQIILEIVINLIGAEIFSILLFDEKTRQLVPVASEGIETSKVPTVPIGSGVIGQTAQSGENLHVGQIGDDAPIDLLNPIVCIPLAIKDKVIGVIAIYKLLQQKKKFANVDYELFTLLAGHAATAVFSAKLYSESERKLSTIQGFINLLTK
ncbi:MAG: GAF domain-containing protein [Bdellovibrionota bacterium]